MRRLTPEEEAQGFDQLIGAGRRDGKAFAEGQPAKHARGVLYQGEWETLWDGTAVAVRLHARALASTGMPVLLKSFSGKVVNRYGVPEPVFVAGVPKLVRDEIGTLDQTSIATLTGLVKHIVVHNAEQLQTLLIPRHAVHADVEVMLAMRKALYESTALYTVWERDRIEPNIAELLARVGQCWVPCDQNRELLVGSGLAHDRVHVVPHPFDPNGIMSQLTRRRPIAERRFYSIGRWEPRKGYDKLMEAFLIAHGDNPEASLTIKHSGNDWKGYPSAEETLRQLVQRHRPREANIRLIGDRIPHKDLVRLHFDSNIYVCSSHGEAWCLPAFDAKVAGNAMVHVPYGGTADFEGPLDQRVAFDMADVHPSYGWPAGTRWADYSVDALADALRLVRAPATFERADDFEERFSLDAVGWLMRDLILELVDRIDPKAARELATYRR